MISEISNEIFLFFFFDFIFSSRVTSACVFLFLCFFHKMQVHTLDSEQDNHILPFPTTSLRHSILSFVSTEIAECLHKKWSLLIKIIPACFATSQRVQFSFSEKSRKNSHFFQKISEKGFPFSKISWTSSHNVLLFSPFSLLCLAHSREIIRLIYARICNFAQNYGEKTRTTA